MLSVRDPVILKKSLTVLMWYITSLGLHCTEASLYLREEPHDVRVGAPRHSAAFVLLSFCLVDLYLYSLGFLAVYLFL